MLTNLYIQHFILIEKLELEFQSGMTVFTGETGSGKTIIIKAIHFASGHKSNINFIRPGHQSAQVCLQFDIKNHLAIQNWLNDQALANNNECHLRRVIQKNGRTRAYINGQLVAIAQLKALSSQLIEIHGQHAQHTLLETNTPRIIIDNFGEHHDLCAKVKQLYTQHTTTQKQLNNLAQSTLKRTQRLEYLQFISQELKDLQLQSNEWDKLGTTQKKLSSKEELLKNTNHALNILQQNDDSLCTKANHIHQTLEQCFNYHQELKNSRAQLMQAIIHLEEAALEIKQIQESINHDDKSLPAIEQRLSELHACARKYRIEPPALLDFLETTLTEIKSLQTKSNNAEQLKTQLQELSKDYVKYAKQLTHTREQAVTKFNQQLAQHMQDLNLPKHALCIDLSPEDYAESLHPHGLDTLTFLAQPNPGHPPQLLNKIVSGGELSRMSLAIKVTQKQQKIPPLIIFDEVDAGIGGKTAEKVGAYLSKLGQSIQVLVISHLPQVEHHAQQLIKVQKKITKQTTVTKAQTIT